MSVEQLERELGDRIRRTLADVMPRLEAEAARADLTGAIGMEKARPMGRRRAVPWSVAVAVVGVVALAAGIRARSGPDGDAPIDPVSGPPRTAGPYSAFEAWPDDFARLLDPVLPDGFRVVHAGRWPLMAVAYDDAGVRLEVLVDVGGDGQPVEGRSPDLVVSPDGDIVSGSVMYGLDLIETSPGPPASAGAAPVLPGVLDDVAAAFAGGERDDILGAMYPVMDSAALRSLIDTTASERLGDHVSNRQFAADFTFEYFDDDVRYSVTVIRSDHPLPDGIVDVEPRAATGRTWANNWQLVVTAAGDEDDSVDHAVIADLLAAIEPLLDAWRPPVHAEVPICDTHVLKAGESLAGIADRYDVDEASLRAANPDADVNLLLGSTVQIPCPD